MPSTRRRNRSRAITKAVAVMPGGNSRTTPSSIHTVLLPALAGAHVWDIDGSAVDFNSNYTSLVLGHATRRREGGTAL
jgi:glutamate-1-semialdehyde aminotransferase